MSDQPFRIVDLGQKFQRYDLSKLPKKKRRSSSFVRRERSKTEADNVSSYVEEFSTAVSDEEELPTATPRQSNCTGHAILVHEADALDAYKLELVTGKGFLLLDSSLTIAALQDFDPDEGSILKANKYQIVRRHQKSFMGTSHWVYCCSCNPRGMELVSALPGELLQTFEDFQHVFTTCIHGNAAKFFMERYETINDIDPIQDPGVLMDHGYNMSNCEIHELPSSSSMVCVDAGNGNYGFVGCEHSKMKCFTCRYETHNCVHVKHITQCLESENSDVPQTILNMVSITTQSSQPVSGSGPVCHSKLPIPFVLPPYITNILQAGLLSVCSFQSGVYVVVPPLLDTPCPVCHSPWSADNPLEMGWCQQTATAFSMTATFRCKVFHRKCSNSSCTNILQVDGLEFGFLYIGKRIISYEVLRDYMHLFFHTGITLHAFFNVWQQRNVDVGNFAFRQLIDYNSWRFAWYAFLRLLDINYHHGWICPRCGPQPDIIVCDATSVAFQRQFLQTRSNTEEGSATQFHGR